MTLVAIEEILGADTTGTTRDALLAELATYHAAVTRKLRGLLPAEEYLRVEKLKQAIEASVAVLPQMWMRANSARQV